MKKLLSALIIVMNALGNWFGLSDSLCLNPVKLEFESCNLVQEADIAVSTNSALKYTLEDNSTLTYWKSGKANGAYIEIDFGAPTEIDTVVLTELTDNVKLFKIYAMTDNGYASIYEQDRIMTYRLCDLDSTVTDKIKIELSEIYDEVKIGSVEVYNEKRSDEKFRVADYATMAYYSNHLFDADYFEDYFEVTTDLILFSAVHLDKQGNIVFTDGEEIFAEIVEKAKKAIGDKDVNIWCTVLFQFQSDDPELDNNDYIRNFLKKNMSVITGNLKAFTEKYDLDGIDFDWEHPTELDQFAAYNKLITETAEFTKVSVACTTWNFLFSDKAVRAVDHFNLMSYDIFDSRGNHSNIYDGGRAAIEKMIGFGVPKEKIFLGIPSYCRPVNGDGYWGSYNSHPELGKYGNKIEDEIYYIDGEMRSEDVYYNSYTDFRDKTALSLQFGCGGVMIFNMHSDIPFSEENSLHRAVYDALN